MDDIPITFEHRGKRYSGHFSQVQGSGSTAVWHLYSDDKKYLGRLRRSESLDFFFDGSDPKEELEYKAREFGNYIYEKGDKSGHKDG